VSIRSYQARALGQIDDGTLLVMPTGTGKTRVLCEVARREAEAGGRPLWVAHRTELLGQASKALRDEWLEPELNVWVRSVQELRRGGGPRATMLLLDEAHHYVSDDWSVLRREQYPHAKLVGATATPERGDGRPMGELFTKLVVGITVGEALADGYLVPSETLRPDRALGPGELAQDPVKAYVEHANGTKAIVFAPNVELAIQYATRFRDEANTPTAAIWGDMPAKDRVRILASYTEGTTRVLVSVAVLTEGFDVPDTETVILARGFGTASGYIQAVGRGKRPSPGKKRNLVLDLRGCSHEHGEPDDERTYHLEGRGIRRPGDDIEVKFCPVCGAPVVSTECEQCGHSGAMRLRPPRVLGLPIDRFARVRNDDNDARAQRLAKWLGEARQKGWKEGQAKHRFKAAYGNWPTTELIQKARLLAG
jgi:DNA repair protein RadD